MVFGTSQLKRKDNVHRFKESTLEIRAKLCWALEPGNDKIMNLVGNSHVVDNGSHLLWVFHVLVG